MEEDERGLEAEVAHLTSERTSLLLKLETSIDEVSALHSQVGKDKKAMVEDYQKALEQISLMAMNVVHSNTAFAVTDQGFQMACLTLPTHFLQSSLRIWGAPRPQQPLKLRLRWYI